MCIAIAVKFTTMRFRNMFFVRNKKSLLHHRNIFDCKRNLAKVTVDMPAREHISAKIVTL